MSETFWHEKPEGEVHTAVFDYVQSVESNQSDTFDRFLKLATLYDPFERMGIYHSLAAYASFAQADWQVSENVCKSTVDTVAAIIARDETSARFITEDGEWSQQRRAKTLEWYVEVMFAQLEVHRKAHRCFKDMAILGTGIAKVWHDTKRIHVERVLIDEIIVDEGSCKTTHPPDMHQRMVVSKAVLKAKWPEWSEQIDRAHQSTGGLGFSNRWAEYRDLERDQIVVVESWRLPIGDQEDEDDEDEVYIPGRHTICIEGADLHDEPYHRKNYPFAKAVWNDRTTGWYGCGLVEDIAGHQRMLNKLNWQIDRQLDQLAVPTTFVHIMDAAIAVKSTSRAGTIVPYKVKPPEVKIPPAVSGETYARHDSIKNSAYEFSGVSRLAATSYKPPGLESAVALREYRDITTERFAVQEKAYERFVLDIAMLIVECAKEMDRLKREDGIGKGAPVAIKKTRFGSRKIKWKDVDLGEAKYQISAASSLSRTPAGRMQLVVEFAQAGIISQDEARRLLQHPDLERAMSLYNAALEDIERTIEEILDGADLVPGPFQNLKMGVWRMEMAYLKAEADGAPPEVLDRLHSWTVQAAWILAENEQTKQQGMPGMPGGMMAGGEGMPPGPMPTGGPMPMMPQGPPEGAPPMAAFAQPSMNLQPE